MSIIALFLPGQGPAYASVFVQDEDAQELQPGFTGVGFRSELMKLGNH